jgi:hypothetical protein
MGVVHCAADVICPDPCVACVTVVPNELWVVLSQLVVEPTPAPSKIDAAALN